MKYTVRRENGCAAAIEQGVYTVLILETGAQRNEEEVERIVRMLNQADAIKRVIAELEKRRQINLDFCDYNSAGAYQEASDMLQEVLDGENDHSGIPETDSEEAKQIPGTENEG